MVKHNNVIPYQHFHKKWARRVQTWLDQPAQKRIRREKRKIAAAKAAPRPSSGLLRPLVRCPTQKYNTKVRLGRGFTLAELKEAGVSAKYARTVGIAVDARRRSKSEEAKEVNASRLKDYLGRLVVFTKGKKNSNEVPQLAGPIVAAPAPASAVSFTTVTDEMKEFNAYAALRTARSDARLVGIRKKQAAAAKEEKKPGAGDD